MCPTGRLVLRWFCHSCLTWMSAQFAINESLLVRDDCHFHSVLGPQIWCAGICVFCLICMLRPPYFIRLFRAAARLLQRQQNRGGMRVQWVSNVSSSPSALPKRSVHIPMQTYFELAHHNLIGHPCTSLFPFFSPTGKNIGLVIQNNLGQMWTDLVHRVPAV